MYVVTGLEPVVETDDVADGILVVDVAAAVDATLVVDTLVVEEAAAIVTVVPLQEMEPHFESVKLTPPFSLQVLLGVQGTMELH